MSAPAVTAAALDLYRRVGDGLTRYDDRAGWLLLLLCDALAVPLQPLNDLADSRWSTAVDPDSAPDVAWLGQWVGVRYDPRLSEAVNRGRVRDRRQWRRGTLDAIRQAAAETLDPGASVLIAEREGGAYRIAVATYAAQTPDPAKTLAAIRAVIPAGHVLTYTAAEGNTWLQIRESFATWQDVADEFDTWEDVRDGSLI